MASGVVELVAAKVLLLARHSLGPLVQSSQPSSISQVEKYRQSSLDE